LQGVNTAVEQVPALVGHRGEIARWDMRARPGLSGGFALEVSEVGTHLSDSARNVERLEFPLNTRRSASDISAGTSTERLS
jgi:hypothetical protein